MNNTRVRFFSTKIVSSLRYEKSHKEQEMTTLEKKPDFSLYSNAFGFLRQPLDFDPVNSDAEWIVTGVPFDLATTGRSGSRFGPEAIRKASVNLAS
ncbi:arginase family protein [Endozoicomonas sp. GU-1]